VCGFGVFGSASICVAKPYYVACLSDCTKLCFRLAGLFFRLSMSKYIIIVEAYENAIQAIRRLIVISSFSLLHLPKLRDSKLACNAWRIAIGEV
jgi:hypothetical protein